MDINIYNYNNVLIKSFKSSNMPKIGKDEYILIKILNNIYNNHMVVFVNENTIKILTIEEYKSYGKELKKKYKQEKKKKEIDDIKKNNNQIIDLSDPTNINIVDNNNTILKTITQNFYKSTYLLYKPFIKNEYPNMIDVKIDENTIKLMSEEQYKEYKREQNKLYREKNRNKLIEYDKKYNQEHKKEAKEYYELNKDIIKEYKKKYREEHKEELKIKRNIYIEKKKEETTEKLK